MTEKAIQDRIPHNHCFGCGPDNAKGLRIKSFWQESGEAVCTYQPEAHQTAGPEHVLNGGIIATLIDCHCIGTAIAEAHQRENRDIGTAPLIWYVTGSLSVRYLAPTPIDKPVTLRARVRESKGRKSIVECALSSEGRTTAEGELVAIRVPAEWRGLDE